MNAYLLSHTGLGDNLYMTGAVRYLLQYYEKIYFICKDIHYDNVKLFYKNNDNVIIVPIDSKNEFADCKKIINDSVYEKNDVLISGCHKGYLKSKITNTKLLHRKKEEKRYSIDYDTLTSNNYSFIEDFYNDNNLDLNIFFDYYDLPITIESQKYYQMFTKYNKIIFIHSRASNMKLNFPNLLKKNVMDPSTIMVCADENVYASTKQSNEAQLEKFNLCSSMVNIPLLYYLDLIKNCHEIYIIDSCFTGIILPLVITNKLKAETVRIIQRDLPIIL